MNRTWIFILLFISLLISSCHQKQGEIITKRIQYDVNIKSPDPNYDWWIQNLVGPQRERLVRLLLKGAKQGKYQAYDYYFHPISKAEVSKILNDSVLRKVRQTTPPYMLIDTLVIEKIGINDIQKLRFLEEWKLNPENFAISKKVLGIAPIAKRYDQLGIERWQPLFWIFPDAGTLKQIKRESQP